MIIKLYTNPGWLIPGKRYIPLLYPRFGFLENKNTPWTSAAWNDHGYDSRFISFVDHIEDADYVVVPHDYNEIIKRNPDLFNVIVEEARKVGKPLLAHNTGDVPGPFLANGVVLRAADYRFNSRLDAIIVPYPVEDLIEKYCDGVFDVRKKTMIPTVGFVGWARMPFRSRIRSYIQERRIRIQSILDQRFWTMTKGIFWRAQALRALNQTNGLILHVINRGVFGARKDMVGNIELWRKDFVSNLKNCDYALCVKGDENASFRFYEALSLGRIPLLVDTECVLPLEHDIDYRSFCVVIDYKEVSEIGKKIIEFHQRVSPKEFEAMQRRARSAFIRYLRMDSFSEHLARMLHDRLKM